METKSSLGKNIFIFGLGTSLSKLMSVLLIGLYTRHITTEDFGYYDILFTVISMMTPLVTLQIIDALYRYLLDSRDESDANRAVTASFAVVVAGLGLAVGVLSVINSLTDIRMGWLLPLYSVTSVMLIFFQQTARGLRRNTVYAMSGVLYTAVMAGANILFIVGFGMSVEALFISVIIADVIAILFIELTVGVCRRVKIKALDMWLVKSMCRYSIPLLPNALIWWLLMLLSRISISAVLGTDANGIFAASAKFPALLMTVYNIFGLAWQESAITEYGSKDRNEYYTITFNRYMRLLLSSLLILLSVTRGVTAILIGEDYASAWLYIPYLYFGSVFAAFSQFYGTGYLSAKKTVGAFVTTAIGVACGASVLITVPALGIQAAALAQMAAYLAVFLIRTVHTRQFFRIRVDLRALAALSVLAVLFTFGYFRADLRLDLAMLGISVVIFVIFNLELIKRMYGMASETLMKRRAKP
jgi:O-antigen/teichoic acid export membrane protein